MDSLKRLTEMLHSLMCETPHANSVEELMTGRDENKCYFYLENTMTDTWLLDDHVKWTGETEDFYEWLGCSCDEALGSLLKVLDLLEKVNQLTKWEISLFTRLLHLHEDVEDD